MDNFVKQVIEEKFTKKKQQRYFYAKANDKSLPKKERKKWKKWSEEFSDKTDFTKLPEKAEEQLNPENEIEEIVDFNGNIKYGNKPGNLNGFIRSKKTSDEVVSATMGQMGTFGILGGPTNASKTLKYWAESDMSKALGADETIADPDTNYNDAVDTFQDKLDVPEDEAKERAKQMGYDPQLPDGKIRLIENPLNYINEYLTKKTKRSELVKKSNNNIDKKTINPIIRRQLKSIKQTLKNNNLSLQDITEYLEDDE